MTHASYMPPQMKQVVYYIEVYRKFWGTYFASFAARGALDRSIFFTHSFLISLITERMLVSERRVFRTTVTDQHKTYSVVYTCICVK